MLCYVLCLGLAYKGTLDSSQIEPPILSLYLVVPMFYLLSFFVSFFFSFHQGPIQTSLTELGTPE